MCCLIATPLNPGCTLGVSLKALHFHRKIFIIALCKILEWLLPSSVGPVVLDNADEEDVASSPVMYWLVLGVNTVSILLRYTWKDLFQSHTPVTELTSDASSRLNIILIRLSENRQKQKSWRRLFFSTRIDWLGIDVSICYIFTIFKLCVDVSLAGGRCVRCQAAWPRFRQSITCFFFLLTWGSTTQLSGLSFNLIGLSILLFLFLFFFLL